MFSIQGFPTCMSKLPNELQTPLQGKQPSTTSRRLHNCFDETSPHNVFTGCESVIRVNRPELEPAPRS